MACVKASLMGIARIHDDATTEYADWFDHVKLNMLRAGQCAYTNVFCLCSALVHFSKFFSPIVKLYFHILQSVFKCFESYSVQFFGVVV